MNVKICLNDVLLKSTIINMKISISMHYCQFVFNTPVSMNQLLILLCSVCEHVIFSVYAAQRRGTQADNSQGRGPCGQLCPSLLHPRCQPGLLPPSWNLHHRAVHLSA